MFIRCWNCKGRAILKYSHSYKYSKSDLKLWNNVYYEICPYCHSFLELNSREIDIKEYIRKYEYTKQEVLF